jgi:nitroreductase
MDPVLERMAAHRSVRRYRGEPVDERLVEGALAAAQRAATSHSIQAYSLLRVRDPARRARLAVLCGDQAQVAQAPVLLVVCADQRRHRLVAAAREAGRVDNLETFLLGVVDATLLAQNLVLALEAQGLGTCYIGGLRNRLPEVDALLEVPRGVMPLFGLCAGWPDEDERDAGPLRPRLPLQAVLHEERWPDEAQVLEQVARHDRDVLRWYAARGRPGRSWSESMTRLFSRRAREHLRDYYESKGAELG